MLVARSFVGCLLALSLSAVGCGGGASIAPAPASDSATADKTKAQGPEAESEGDRAVGLASERIARLIPSTTAIYIQFESFKRFDAVIGRLARAHESVGRQIDELGRELHRLLPGDERQIHQDRPVGLAISLPIERDPQLTFVLPVKDLALYKRSLQLDSNVPQPVFDGSYLAVTTSSLYERPREPVVLASGVPDAPMTMRVDLARLDHRFGSQMRKALLALASGGEFAGLPLQTSSKLQEVAQPLLFALEVGRQAELSLDIDSDRLHLRCEVETRDAGVLAGWTANPAIDLAPLARSIVASDSISLVAGCDPSVIAARLAPMLTASDAQAERLAGLLERFADPFGTLIGISSSLIPGKTHISMHLQVEDHPGVAHELASNFELFSRSGFGMAVQSKSSVMLEDVEVQDLLVHLDASSMCALTGEVTQNLPAVQARLDGFSNNLFGSDTVRVRIACFQGHGLIAIGNDNAWFRRTLLWAKQDKDLTPPEVSYALKHLGEVRAAAILRLDLSRWEQGSASWLAQVRSLYEPVRLHVAPEEGSLQALDPEPLTLAVGAEGRTLRVGLSMGLPSELSVDMARR